MNTPYSEYWMGTHITCPSFLKTKDMLLSEFIKNYTANQKTDLTFLFKVLSVNQALSIQAHPDKKLAAILHAKKPDLYKDANHKPEMCIALTPFEALYGFLPVSNIFQNIDSNPIFTKIIPADLLGNLKSGSKDSLKQLLKLFFEIDQDKPKLGKIIDELIKNINNLPISARTPHQALALRLFKIYQNDIGILIEFFMNLVKLMPGEAIAIMANEPHAYIEGDCVECMATSDNVVRCGLTPKPKDAQTLIEMLTYEEKMSTKISPINIANSLGFKVSLYDPKFEEFVIYSMKVMNSGAENKLSLYKWSIMIILNGNVNVHKALGGAFIKATQYSTWILEPGEYIFNSIDQPSEIYIASERPT